MSTIRSWIKERCDGTLFDLRMRIFDIVNNVESLCIGDGIAPVAAIAPYAPIRSPTVPVAAAAPATPAPATPAPATPVTRASATPATPAAGAVTAHVHVPTVVATPTTTALAVRVDHSLLWQPVSEVICQWMQQHAIFSQSGKSGLIEIIIFTFLTKVYISSLRPKISRIEFAKVRRSYASGIAKPLVPVLHCAKVEA